MNVGSPWLLSRVGALRRAFAHDGPVLVDVVSAGQELAMPAKATLGQAAHFSLYMLKAVMDDRGAELIDLARTNRGRCDAFGGRGRQCIGIGVYAGAGPIHVTARPYPSRSDRASVGYMLPARRDRVRAGAVRSSC
jgi:hypothetical protein